jgi:hypothetical protein
MQVAACLRICEKEGGDLPAKDWVAAPERCVRLLGLFAGQPCHFDQSRYHLDDGSNKTQELDHLCKLSPLRQLTVRSGDEPPSHRQPFSQKSKGRSSSVKSLAPGGGIQ